MNLVKNEQKQAPPAWNLAKSNNDRNSTMALRNAGGMAIAGFVMITLVGLVAILLSVLSSVNLPG